MKISCKIVKFLDELIPCISYQKIVKNYTQLTYTIEVTVRRKDLKIIKREVKESPQTNGTPRTGSIELSPSGTSYFIRGHQQISVGGGGGLPKDDER